MSKQKGKKRVLLKIFGLAMCITFGVCVAAVGGTIAAYNAFIHTETVETATIEDVVMEEQIKEQVESEGTESTLVEIDQTINKTIAVFGTDFEGLRTDVIIVANFNSQTGEVNVISVPRDTRVEWKPNQRELLPQRNSWVEVSKINEMTAWGGMNQIRGLIVKELENILGIKIDQYVIVSLSAFREIIDAIGGIEFDVPVRMKKDDYSQNLHIDLYPGVQHLDGDKAEQLVRFRDYITGDLQRIEVQQSFLKEVSKKVLSPQIIAKLPKIIPILFQSVKTDISLIELLDYYPYVQMIDKDNINFYTVPGTDDYYNNISYYIIDMDQTEQLISEIFYKE